MRRVSFLLLFLVLGSVIGILASAVPVKADASDPWADAYSNWQYRREITISNPNSEDLTDFQVKITLDSTNFDFSKASVDGSDIRFADTQGNPLSYWIEKWDNANEEATIWVKVSSLPANGETTIYMYYGNSGAESESDGEAVFEFFDDFNAMFNESLYSKYPGNPVLDVGSTYDSRFTADPWVIFNGTGYQMWYTAYDGTHARVAYATSTDGIHWTKYPGNPVLDVGASGSYDSVHAHKPSVVFFNGTYYMYYSAVDDSGIRRIALATSNTPYGPFTKVGVVIEPTETWEGNFIDTPCVMYDEEEGIFKMWYSGGKLPDADEPVGWGYATSTDGIHWTKYPGNPIAQPPNDGSWFSKALGGIFVFKFNGTYFILFNGFDDNEVSRIGILSSQDGVTVNLSNARKIIDLGPSDSWDDKMIYKPSAVYINGTLRIWFNAKASYDNKERIGLAESSGVRGTTWTLVGNPYLHKENGALTIVDNTVDSSYHVGITSNFKPASNTMIESMISVENLSTDPYYPGQGLPIIIIEKQSYSVYNDNDVPCSSHEMILDNYDKNVKHQSRYGTSWGTEDTIYSSFSEGVWYIARAVMHPNSQDWLLLDKNYTQLGALNGNADDPQGFYGTYYLSLQARSGKMLVKWLRVRKYTSPEPTTSVSATEETNPNPQNNPPSTPTISISPTDIYVGTTITVTASTTDPDGDTLTYEYQFLRGAMILQDWSTMNTYTVQQADAHSTITINVRACDPSGLCNESSTTVSVLNSPPSAPSITVTNAVAGSYLQLSASSSDSDGDALTYYFRVTDKNTSTILLNWATSTSVYLPTSTYQHTILIEAYASDAYGVTSPTSNTSVFISSKVATNQTTFNSQAKYYALSFDGEDDVANTPLKLSPIQSFTIIAIFNDAEYDHDKGSTVVGRPYNFGIFADDNHVAYFGLRDNETHIFKAYDSYLPGSVCVAGVYDASSKVAKLYINGQHRKTIDVSALGTSWRDGANLSVKLAEAGPISGGGVHFKGKIYLVLIYSRALSDSEIQAIYADPMNPPTSGLVLWYAPDSVDTANGVWKDLSGNGNDGTIYGATPVRVSIPSLSVYDAVDGTPISPLNVSLALIANNTTTQLIPSLPVLPWNETVTLNVSATGYYPRLLTTWTGIDNLAVYLEPVNQTIEEPEVSNFNTTLSAPQEFSNFNPNFIDFESELRDIFTGRYGMLVAALMVIGLVVASLKFHQNPMTSATVLGVAVVYIGSWAYVNWGWLYTLVMMLISAGIMRAFGRWREV